MVLAFQNCKSSDRTSLAPSNASEKNPVSPPAQLPLTQQSNCNSPEYNTQSDCNQGKPAHSTCSQQTGGCYTWECNEDYTLTNNDCVPNNAPNSAPEEQCEAGEHTSQRACNNLKPTHSTCSQQDSGCYAWLCNEGYTLVNNQCQATRARSLNCNNGEYNTQVLCDQNKPANSTCSANSDRCYTWSCDTGYTLVSNQCQATSTNCSNGEYSTQALCDQNKPANSTCSQQAGGCYSWQCNTDYRKQGSQCITCKSQASCDNTNPAHSTCSANSDGCYTWSCDTGYTLVNNQCQATSTKSINGECARPPYSPTKLCKQGTLKNVSSSPMQWNCEGSHGGTNDENCNTCINKNTHCDRFGCSIHHGEVHFYPFKGMCDNSNKPAHSHCYRIPTGQQPAGCYTWRCNSGYDLTETDQCEKITATNRGPVRGICPLPPYDPNHLCVQGTYKSVSDTHPLQWDCEGINNGRDHTNCNACPSTPLKGFTFYVFESTCNANKPVNSTCHQSKGYVRSECGKRPGDGEEVCYHFPPSQNGDGCWVWSCNRTYQLNSAGTACELATAP